MVKNMDIINYNWRFLHMNFINKMTKDSGEHKTNNIINIIKGSAISIFFSIVALIIFSIILNNSIQLVNN